jgi:hypothetical protein
MTTSTRGLGAKSERLVVHDPRLEQCRHQSPARLAGEYDTREHLVRLTRELHREDVSLADAYRRHLQRSCPELHGQLEVHFYGDDLTTAPRESVGDEAIPRAQVVDQIAGPDA